MKHVNWCWNLHFDGGDLTYELKYVVMVGGGGGGGRGRQACKGRPIVYLLFHLLVCFAVKSKRR